MVANGGEPQVSVGDIELPGRLVEPQTEWSTAELLVLVLLRRRRLHTISAHFLRPFVRTYGVRCYCEARFKQLKGAEKVYQLGLTRAKVFHRMDSPIHRTTRPSAKPAYGPRPWGSNSSDSGPNTSSTNSSFPNRSLLRQSRGQRCMTWS